MRVLLLTLLLVVLLPATARGYDAPYPLLNQVATRIAGQAVDVRCYDRGEPGDPFESYGAWGYVYLDEPREHMAREVCAGALGIAADSAPRYNQGLGALVLAHESYHLAKRYGTSRGDEAKTECRAIRHFRYVVQFLGGSPERADDLISYALAVHWRIAALFREYFDQSCQVPWWWK